MTERFEDERRNKTDEIRKDFLARGGESVPLVTNDIQTLTALSHLLAANPPASA